MPEYTLFDPTTGQQWTLTEFKLTRELELNCILLRENEHLGIITHRDVVLFTQWCAGKMLARLKGDPDQSVTHALTLVDRWLENEKSITSEELKDAAEAAARAGAEAAAEAIWAAADAADAAEAAAEAARFAAQAAWAAARAARAVWAAADVARSAEDRGLSYKSQAQWLVEHLQSGK